MAPTKLKILFVTDFPPSFMAGNAGSSVFAYYIQQLCQRGHNISAICLGERSGYPHSYELAGICDEFNVIEYPKSLLSHLKKVFLRLRYPPEYAVCRSSPIARHIAQFVQKNRPDVIHVVHPWLIHEVRKALEEQDKKHEIAIIGHVMDIPTQEWFERIFHQQSIRRILGFARYAHMSWYEFDDYAHTDHLLVHTESDREVVQSFTPKPIEILLSPIWFDAIDISKSAVEPRYKNELLYVGNSSDSRMHESLKWFLELVFPLILSAFPSTVLHIVGVKDQHKHLWHNPPNTICHSPKLSKELMPFYEDSSALVFPLQQGRYSVHVKLLNAFASGCVVVMTPEANFSARAHHNIDALIAKTPEKFANEVINVLKQPEWAADIANRALQRIHRTYPTSTSIIDDLENTYLMLKKGD